MMERLTIVRCAVINQHSKVRLIGMKNQNIQALFKLMTLQFTSERTQIRDLTEQKILLV